MNIGSIGDLAQSYAMQSKNTALKNDIQRLTFELSSGKVADAGAAIRGNAAYASDLERSLIRLDGYDLSTSEAGQFAEGVQTVLTQISDVTTSFRNTLITATNSGLDETSNSVLFQANAALSSVVNAMNTDFGGRALFGGTSTDIQSIASPEDIIDAVKTAVTGAGSVDDILTAAKTWFDDPAGFATIGYLGSDIPLASMSLADDKTVQFNLKGNDQVFRDTIRNLVVVAIADDSSLALTDAQQTELFQKTTNDVLNTHDEIINAQSQIGFTESQIEAAKVRNSSERSSLEIARSDLFSIDPYQAATELEQVQFQLQSLYAITSRMSQLSLVNYL